MTISEASLHKHLEFASDAIARMSQNSFLAKGWCITIVTAMMAASIDGYRPTLAIAALPALALFWIVDAYYLRQERLFRALFDKIRTQRGDTVDFSMDTSEFRSASPFCCAILSPSLVIIYGGLTLVIASNVLVGAG